MADAMPYKYGKLTSVTLKKTKTYRRESADYPM